MKRTLICSLVVCTMFIGAGCEETRPAPPAPAIPAPVATPVSTPEPTSTKSMTTPEKLAFPGILPEKEVTNKLIRISTNKGEIVFELLPKEGPKAASNFVYLVSKKFYDGLTFHRVIPGFMAQGGDPEGMGYGGPGYKFEDDKVNLPYNVGIVAMANSGPNTNGSQFFIMTANTPLEPKYSIFGRVVSGQDVVQQLVNGDVMKTVTIEDKK